MNSDLSQWFETRAGDPAGSRRPARFRGVHRARTGDQETLVESLSVGSYFGTSKQGGAVSAFDSPIAEDCHVLFF
jgi:hypothetical protein